ncbi:purine-binding chemotaxis protein CheW [Emcibacter nanhaiensis]|uniref:Purine-binding chemotaxis protein CheW n=2 Tax=Emcibacter nanhaiensis TaxID=1505037 RepID=A0A501PC81_9PROT|nr:purine-binding chemotaxis protein CheW [Emcibacter nanhaiensis]
MTPEATEDDAAVTGETSQYISFVIGNEEYCVDIIHVREIKGWVPVTPLPNSPEFMLGVLNLRGVIVPIFDMRCRFGLGRTDATPLHVMIIVAVGERVMGILVDAVSDILTVGANQVLDVPELDQRGDRKFLAGLITHEDKMVALLSLEELFNLDSIVEKLSA